MERTMLKSYLEHRNFWSKIIILPILLFFLNPISGYTQFSETYSGSLPILQYGTVDWGDFDRDGDLDILMTGYNYSQYLTRIYENTGSDFVDAYPSAFPGVWVGTADWGDYDSDGDLDFVLTGNTGAGYISKIYQNTGVGFSEVYSGSLAPVTYSSTDWGDYDNDGDLDLILCGETGSGRVTTIYENTGIDFVPTYPGSLTSIAYGSVSWGDYDNDGDLDILLTGYDSGTVGKIYQNTGNGFIEVCSGQITGVCWGTSEWGDYDSDGDLDIVLSGTSDLSNTVTKVFQNNEGSFAEVFLGQLVGVHSWECQNNVAWCDFDSDGDLDVVVTGRNQADVRFSKIYSNNGNNFTEAFAGSITPVSMSSVAWGDYNNDCKPDLLVTGNSVGGVLINKLYRNDCPAINTKAQSPTNCVALANGTDVLLNWSKATDSQTAQDGLSYNIYVVSDEDNSFIRSPHSDTTIDEDNGLRYVASFGSIQYCQSGYPLKNLAEGTYYWAVQAVDAGFLGGSFSQVNSFIIGTEINVLGNSISIENGDLSPDFADNTDFGETGMGETVNHTFSIHNCGSYNIELSGNPRVSVVGDGFELVLDAPQTIVPGSSADFIVSFSPANCSLYSAEITIANNDPDEGNYSFSISGTGLDNVNPDYPDLLPISGECLVEASIPQTTDNCAGIIDGVTSDPLIYDSQGTYIINWSFSDEENNLIVVPQTVTVEDVTNPEIDCPNSQTVILSQGQNSYLIIGDEFDPITVSDNCEIFSISNDVNGLASLDGCDISIGLNTITWSVTDVGGNQSNCSFDLLVEEFVEIDRQNAYDLKIYPNPSDDKVFYVCGDADVISIQICDVAGRIIAEHREVLSKGQLDISEFKAGIYIVNIQTTKYFKSFNLIKK